MTLSDELIQFANQFHFIPLIEHTNNRLRRHLITVVGGMGGSHLGAGLLNALFPELAIWVHKDYGLPSLPEHLACETLFIASSYSGNTEETLDFAKEAQAKNFSLAVISGGGALTRFAEAHELPLVRLPKTGLPPRLNLGTSALAVLAHLKEGEHIEELQTFALHEEAHTEAGIALAQTLRGKTPIIYASTKNFPLAYFWKISFNETAKIPAFCNMLPEANHNEIEGFAEEAKVPLHVIMLTDADDHPQIQKRMRITEEILTRRGVSVSMLPLRGETRAEKIFGGAAAGISAALQIAKTYGHDPLSTPVIEALKKKLASL